MIWPVEVVRSEEGLLVGCNICVCLGHLCV